MLVWLTTAALAAAPIGPTCAGPEPTAADGRGIHLSGPESIIDVGGFRLHWTHEGSDRLVGDHDGDGTPDLVEVVADALVGASQDFEADGWRALAADNGDGGSDALDVYFLQIDANGYANAATAADHESGSACYIRLDPDITSLGGDPIARSIAVHELHHCVQFRYTTQAESWVYEAQATLEQYRDLDDPVADLAVGVLWHKRLSEPERPIDDTGDRFEYAGMVWFKFWEEAVGQPLPEVWEALEAAGDWRLAFEAASQAERGTDFGDIFVEHAVWNGFACGRDDGRHYLASAAGCPETSRATVPVTTMSRPVSFTVQLEAGFSSEYYELPHDGSSSQVRVECEVTDTGGGLGLAVVDIGTGQAAFGRAVGPGAVTVDARPSEVPTSDAGTLIVLSSLHDWGASAQCTASRVVVEERGGVCATSAASVGWVVLLLLPLAFRRRS